MKLNVIETLCILMAFLLIGYFIQNKVSILKRYYVPAPLIGGLLLTVILSIINSYSSITLNFSALPIFVAGFFVSIGLRVNIDFLKKGFKWQMIFLGIVIITAFLQNGVSLLIGKIFGKTAAEIVITGSLGLMGDHTVLSTIPEFIGKGKDLVPQLTAFSVLALYIATLAGGILFSLFKKNTDLSTNVKIPPAELNPMEFLKILLIFVLGISIGLIPGKLGFGKFINPAGGGFLVGLILRAVFDVSKVYEVKLPSVNLIGNYSLSMLLVTVFSMFDIRIISKISMYNVIILIIQMAWLMLAAYFVVYKIFKKNALASYVASGLIGFSIGMPASTMSNIQCFSENEGAIPMVLFVVPPVGAWMITVINMYLIPLFL